jgi:hypothetical protein
LDTQFDLGHQWVATLGYQGNSTRHLTHQQNLNLLYASRGDALNPAVNSIGWYSNDSNASFNALLAGIKHAFSRSFQSEAQYRWSKSVDQGSNNFASSQYTFDPHYGYGPSDYDATRALKVFGVWSPTFFRGRYSWAEKVAGGWSVSPILNMHSGFPWTPVFSNLCNFVYAGDACGLTPAAYLGGALNGSGNDAFKTGNFPKGGPAYFTAPAYTPCTQKFPNTCPTAPQRPGIARNSFRGPGYFDLDVTVAKSFGLPKMKVLGEGAGLEIKASFFNVTNKLNLRNDIQANVTDPHFGQAQAGLGGRTIEMQARFSF